MERPQIKGPALSDTLALVRERAGEQWPAVLAEVDPEVREILQSSILANTWYPLDVLTQVLAADIKLFRGGDESVVRTRSEDVVARQLGGIYRIFIRLGSPEHLIKRLSTIHETYLEGIEISPTFDGNHGAVVRYRGFEAQHRLMEPVVLGFFTKALELSGAKDVTATVLTPIAAGKGVFEVDISWS